jgi:hypothetical protein
MNKKFFFIFLLTVTSTVLVFAQNLSLKQLRIFNAQAGVMEDLTSSVVGWATASGDDGYRIDINIGAGSSFHSNKFYMWMFTSSENVPNGTKYTNVAVGMRDSITGTGGVEMINGGVAFIMRTQTETGFMVMMGNQTLLELYCDNL